LNALETALREAARTPVLLVASDFDGTLSDLAPKPDLARPDAACLALLKSLASMHHTHASIISGRTSRTSSASRTAAAPGDRDWSAATASRSPAGSRSA
jgi:trehalose-phosphatase